MKYIACITDSGPLSFRIGRGTSTVATLPYVPGTTLLGGLAAVHARLHHNPEEFSAFFLSEDSYFGNLYPASFNNKNMTYTDSPVYPLPRTALSCKRFGGFRFDEDDPQDDPHHDVWDSLIPWGIFMLSGQKCIKALDAIQSCLVCDEPMAGLESFYRCDPYDKQKMGRAEIKRSLRTRTGINRTTGTVHRGILYSREVLRNMRFWGMLNIPDAYAEAFERFVEDINSSHLLHLGNNRTRGFGRVNLKLDEVEKDKEDTADTLKMRIETFNDKMRREADQAGVHLSHSYYLPLTLTSNTLLVDRLLRYQTTITPDYLAEMWGIVGTELVYQNSATHQVMGWNDLWMLPKPDEIAITMGSVFLFGVDGELNDGQIQTLLQMQSEGIGSRRREGFGRLLIASPFHWEVRDK